MTLAMATFLQGVLILIAGGSAVSAQNPLVAWLGNARPLGVPAGVWPALVFSAVLFGLVHAGKASAEIAAAFPGGLGLALLTYRVRAVWPAVLLHASSGVVIFAVAWFGRSG